MTTPITREAIIAEVKAKFEKKRIKAILERDAVDVSTILWDTSHKRMLIATVPDYERVHLVMVQVAVEHHLNYRGDARSFTFYVS